MENPDSGSPLGWAVELACPVTPDLPQGSFCFLSLGSLGPLQGDLSISMETSATSMCSGSLKRPAVKASEEFLPGLLPILSSQVQGRKDLPGPGCLNTLAQLFPHNALPRFLSPARCPHFLPSLLQSGPLTSLSYRMLISARTSARSHLAHAHGTI